MTQDYIKFKKHHELGEILSLTFKFIRENYKLASKILLKVVGPVFLVLVAAIAYYSFATMGSIYGEGNGFSGILIPMLVLYLAYMLYVSTVTGTVYHIIKSYNRHKGEIVETEVVEGMKTDFGKLLLLTFLSWIIMIAGFMFFLIPGIYLAVPMSMVNAILVFERKGIGESISHSFQLIKQNWWMTFASILCVALIVYLIGLVFQLPAIIYMIFKTIISATEHSASDGSNMFGTGFVVLNVITSIIQYIIYSITPVGFALIYFDLNEKQNFTGTYEAIENLGKN
ncbi:hypothetical protein MKO06_09005 [Gramella sp. GC03-9]|uniref:Glycerophosphoryl diester phosphodiesterase membrane domain-containing protein n=1 Tax=Christiangramia oceanisediminis TaxID=2920386 RepID=A0A9X2I2I8_9FLAO|nr:hypothetical protein [Gramella oceanisediminis]MCP9200044.1 hypothetical protein [Gramella oceanisediminis]